MIKWGTRREIETRRRILVSLWSFAYEFKNHSMVSDGRFDEECRRVNLSILTNRPDLDFWFNVNFQPHTGMWIHKHPELYKLQQLYERLNHD